MKNKVFFLVFSVCVGAAFVSGEEMPLSGEWEVSLSDPASGAAEWRKIVLPGTLDDAGIGAPLALEPKLDSQVLARLQRRFTHVGPAWYRRDVAIPASWEGRPVILELERVLWESRVWVDGRELSSADSLSAPHRHDLGTLSPGHHELLVRVDNSEIHPGISRLAQSFTGPGDRPLAHAYTNHTQIMWNGMLGTLVLKAESGRPHIDKMAVYPRVSPSYGLRIQLGFPGRKTGAATGRVRLVLRSGENTVIAETVKDFSMDEKALSSTIDWELTGAAIQAWDEFHPACYRLEARIPGDDDALCEARFGFRVLEGKGGSLVLNGKRIFLRGTLECAIFPLTGYPPTTVGEWKHILGRAREWGLNHLRFHSWCPPRAAFQAADELGFYLQIELPHWSHDVGANRRSWEFLDEEADRILAEYGNHPSFLLFSMGNELQGDMSLPDKLVRRLRQADARRLYSVTTFTFEKGFGRSPAPSDEFFVTRRTEKGWIRGQGIFNTSEPTFDNDYDKEVDYIKVPVITHEIGQYSVYPDLSEIARYTENLVPLNFMAIKNDLLARGLLNLAPEFTKNTGRFAALLYKEEIERALRTSRFDGFQLLGLQDFPGQGTALVGLLNAFWDSKEVITAEEFRQFCGPVVPLARISRVTLERGEALPVKFELANFFEDMPEAELAWSLLDRTKNVIARGRIQHIHSKAGELAEVGEADIRIPEGSTAEQWTLQAQLVGTAFHNAWKIWIYPKTHPPGVPAGVVFTSSLDEAMRALSEGKRVLFNPVVEQIEGIEGRFLPVFWSPFHSPEKQSGTMGMMCDPSHPALRGFPTESHSDWQWWDLALRSRSVVLDGLPVMPLVRVVDNFERNHSLGAVFEARVGDGKLLFSAIDISHDLEKRPVARQLKAALLSYMVSEEFKPVHNLTQEQLAGFVRWRKQ
ncbi:hypothetical protein OH491_17235 [Termitidicoccus mucosus]|uniref:hypothetical protein n=1 Tax=Termitidicoccus mucosus TaxID=1184151 RepID=UPI00083878D5